MGELMISNDKSEQSDSISGKGKLQLATMQE
jgi:hypothetical protein